MLREICMLWSNFILYFESYSVWLVETTKCIQFTRVSTIPSSDIQTALTHPENKITLYLIKPCASYTSSTTQEVCLVLWYKQKIKREKNDAILLGDREAIQSHAEVFKANSNNPIQK